VEVLEDPGDAVVPQGRQRPAVDRDVQPQQHRLGVREVDDVLVVARGRGLAARRRRRVSGAERAAGGEARDSEEQQPVHDRTSFTGCAVGWPKRIGRPTWDWFGLRMSMPRARPTVASRSGTRTGRSVTSMPLALVLPTTAPPWTPPPASTVAHDVAQ